MNHIEQLKEEYAKAKGFKDYEEYQWIVGTSENTLNKIAQRAFNAALEQYKDNLLAQVDSMDKFSQEFFKEATDFQKGNKTALDNVKVHIENHFLSLKINS